MHFLLAWRGGFGKGNCSCDACVACWASGRRRRRSYNNRMRFTRSSTGVYSAPNAIIVGDVTIGEGSSVWFNAVIRGDVAPIVIGKRVNVQDGAIIHCDTGFPNTIGDEVTIGHGAIVHGTSVGDGSLIGMSATLLGRTRVG